MLKYIVRSVHAASVYPGHNKMTYIYIYIYINILCMYYSMYTYTCMYYSTYMYTHIN